MLQRERPIQRYQHVLVYQVEQEAPCHQRSLEGQKCQEGQEVLKLIQKMRGVVDARLTLQEDEAQKALPVLGTKVILLVETSRPVLFGRLEKGILFWE